MELKGAIILDIDTPTENGRSIIRLTAKTENRVLSLYDYSFMPYFYLLPSNKELSEDMLRKVSVENQGSKASVDKVEKTTMALFGKEVEVFKIYTNDAKNVPLLKDYIREFGECYEYDIPFWKRYLIDKDLSPMRGADITANEEKAGL